MLDLNLLDKPIDSSKYQPYTITELPKLVLGIKVKNKFDESRIEIDSKFNPKRILHFCFTNTLEPVYIYGIELQPNPELKEFFKKLNQFTHTFVISDSLKDYIKNYQNFIKKFNLSCNECYANLYDGLYPIDLKFLPSIINKKTCSLPVDNLSALIKNHQENQWYFQLPTFSIFSLGLCAEYIKTE